MASSDSPSSPAPTCAARPDLAGLHAGRADAAGRADDGVVRVQDAHLHNLRHVSTEFPRNRLVAFTGVSGSGKSSLAFGTVHGESQRRYLESIAPFARRLIGSAMDPQVEGLTGLPPTVALEQRTTGGGARSSVGTVSALSTGIRLLYSRAGHHPPEALKAGSPLHGGRLLAAAFSPNTPEGMCPECHGVGVLHRPTEASMVPDPTLSIDQGAIQAWPGAWLGKNFHDILATLGVVDMDQPWERIPRETRDWILFTEEQPVVTVRPERGVDQAHGTYQGRWRSVNRYLLDTLASTSSEKTRARALRYLESSPCPVCHGHRLTPEALQVTYLGYRIYELNQLPAERLLEVLRERYRALEPGLDAESADTADGEARGAAADVEVSEGGASRSTGASTGGREAELSPEADAERLLLPTLLPVLETMVGLGLGHLTPDRPSRTLSTGELQRLRLAAQLRAGLFGVAYVLDEPSAGLHPSEKGMLLDLFARFVAEGNSVLLVEHDTRMIQSTDWVVDVGPGAGTEGGRVLYSGPVPGLAEVSESRTGQYLRQGLPEPRTAEQAREPQGWLSLQEASVRTLQSVDVKIPLGAFTVVTGVSGSGKTTLLDDVLARTVAARVRTAVTDAATEDQTDADAALVDGGQPNPNAAVVEQVEGLEGIDRLVQITQKPIGRSPRSCLATYTGLFDRVRRLFAETEEARERGWGVGRFSFNVAEGRCPTCQGEGQVEVELVFLPGSYAVCPECHGSRYTPETLEVAWSGRNIGQILDLTVREALEFFAEDARVLRAVRALDAVGLGYLTLGQPATELSGGEAQRIKLATELQRAPRGHTLYLLDEPTTGLHPADTDLLVAELNRLVDQGNTVVAVEHDLRVVAQADHVIDLGPGAGAEGGRIVAQGAPAQVAQDPGSITGAWLAKGSAPRVGEAEDGS